MVIRTATIGQSKFYTRVLKIPRVVSIAEDNKRFLFYLDEISVRVINGMNDERDGIRYVARGMKLDIERQFQHSPIVVE